MRFLLKLFEDMLQTTGLIHLTWGNILLIFVGIILIYLAIAKKYEPFLLLPIGFGSIVANIPETGLLDPGGLIHFFYLGVEKVIYPPLIFLGVGAMTDFGPMIANPSIMILGAFAHIGIFIALIGAKLLGFSIFEAGAIGIIGGADGPMAIYVTQKLAPHLMAQISVAAYSYMALMPLIQPPIMKLLTTKKERQIMMKQLRPVSKTEKIIFPIFITILIDLLLPPIAPLITMFMLGNLLKESGVVDRLAKTASGEFMNVITILLGVSIGSTMRADTFLTLKTLEILSLGLVAFMTGTAGGILGAKLLNKLSGGKINPLIGSAGIASVPIAARVSHSVAIKENPYNFLIMHAMGPNLAGVFGTAIAGGIMLVLLGVH
ncbi:oxaloacetate decarboxylase beta subunit [Caldanaerobacter subterraneus subsp. tengcongensis MB4]|uniref:Na+-transporting methylmalonyl-CoA/oxaloacetate decarboxylase, beta subunit n=4 Tax=Caldanaerobacter subterraneus TaxID=911092 RepID=Q8R932_CALS4|nr:sodium ion-translocating decarboxylase subunit beta [Caldanaerobacter subterraneus]AAM24990.1 Na+-transporting methylmalonyl-CoA/oxaloacetate decarboxylase, beta subunit [Caldanaerobacter subterraneus subsp. tengcongensis MB4]ERM93184.1 glutaconyl-CoA decarboxylase subunit beta [Caldanaerobacter subterraneus subsp. yonseiensis KB-1]KKC29344.1 Na+-transporting methylmalonyl-CoA/oxaloacetate decarboxylase, beta subunit [Caldanaerobacter subterraneus subsp. pacificus DSM 12653]MCS3915427.1 oxal